MKQLVVAVVVIILIFLGVSMFKGQTPSTVVDTGATSTTQTTGNNNVPVDTSAQATKVGMPIVVTSATVTPSDTTALTEGTVNPNGAFTSYWYEYSLATDFSNPKVSQTQSIGSGFTQIPALGYITGLSKDTTYYFRLVAENQYGRVSGGQHSFKTTHNTAAPVGSTPTVKTLAESKVTKNSVSLNGEVTPNKAVTQYWFEYGTTANLGNITAITAAGQGTAKLPVTIALADLNSATTYYYRINAQNQFGTVNGSILNFKTDGPAVGVTPSVVTRNATNIATSSATFHGTINPNGSQTTFWFEYSSDSLFGLALLNTTNKQVGGKGSDTTAVDAQVSGLGRKTTYYVRLVAENNNGTVKGEKIEFKTE